MLFKNAAVLFFASCSLARSLPKKISPRQNPTPISIPAAQSTACGDIMQDVDAPLDQSYSIFWSSDVWQCLQSVPFNPAVATRFLAYWNETIQFQSTLAYLKDPPTGYQQPAVDVLAEIQQIQQRIESGFYGGQYAFEADFQLLAYALNDGHVTISGGAMSAFSFGSPFEIASVSIDGKQDPKVYFTQDIIDTQTQDWTPSAIKTINGEDVNGYLTKFAALNSWGFVESHAEWNALMSSPVLDIQAGSTVFSGGATFYPGDNLTVHFENYTAEDSSTLWDTVWIAVYNELANYTGPLATGGDFYNYFVLGETPASFDPSKIVDDFSNGDTPEPEAPGNWSDASYGAFPEKPTIVQDNLGTDGVVSGYFLEDISTGVLSLPTFDVLPASIGNYTDTVSSFVQNASDAGMKRIIIDLQRNTGGLSLMAYTIFKNFFPDVPNAPFAGSRRRIFPMANALGSATSNFWDSLDETDSDELLFKQEIAAYNWLITNRLDANTGKNFSSWDEYATAAPVKDIGDTFSLTERYDLANVVFDRAAFDSWWPTMYVKDKSEWPVTESPWKPEQIVLFTDGICASACSLFVEMMTEVGVKTVVAGGRPQKGPMQAVGGNRGAAGYSADQLDRAILFARSVDEFVDDNVNGSLPEERDSGMFIKYASINLRDQVRKDEKTPLQFKYEAADCRIYYTFDNLYNITKLWRDVSVAAFDDPSRCVDGSTGFSTTNNPNPSPPPAPDSERPTLPQSNPVVEQVEWVENPEGSLRDKPGKPKGDISTIQECGNRLPGQLCADGVSKCIAIDVDCGNQGKKPVHACLPTCHCVGPSCDDCAGHCHTGAAQEQKIRNFPVKMKNAKTTGRCYPEVGNKALCLANPKS